MNDDDGCPACGSSHADRVKFVSGADDVPLGFRECPHCNAQKCCMCDMGDDVECMSCDA